MPDDRTIWTVIIALGIITFLIRYSFIGFMGGRETPLWAQRLLRYAPASVFPALIAPLILWPPATGGEPDLARALAAFLTLGAGAWSRNSSIAFVAGIAALLILLQVF